VLRLRAHVHFQLSQRVFSIAAEGHGLAQFLSWRSQGLNGSGESSGCAGRNGRDL
jgi:hypothetical protein